MKKILLYGVEDTTADQYQTLAANMGLAMYIVGDDVLEESLKEVFLLNEDCENRHEEVKDSFLILDSLNKDMLLKLLKQFHAIEKPFDGWKILKNSTNEKWTLRKVLQNAIVEGRTAKKAQVLVELIRACGDVEITTMDQKMQSTFKEAVFHAIQLLKSGRYDEQHIDQETQNLSQCLQACKRLYN